jgi:hypothetical protein
MGPALGPMWRQLEIIGAMAPELELLMWSGVALAILVFCGIGFYIACRRGPDDV